MAKIAFIQEELRDRVGVMILSAMLKKHGHTAKVFIDSQTEDLEGDVLEYEPDMIALSTSTPGIKFAIEYIDRFNKPNRKYIIVMGGPHPTFYPDVIETEGLDAICRGEGEYTIVELANAIDKCEDITHISNLWVKNNGKIIKNEVRSFVDLDELPMPDRDIYYKHYPVLANKPTKSFFVVRGCPFGCKFCWNVNYRKIYKGKGTYIRNLPVKKAIEEIKYVKDTYGLKYVQFLSDTNNLNRKWFIKLIKALKKHIDLPYLCNVRADLVDEEMVKTMKETRCNRVDFGIEHGDTWMRNTVLGKALSDEDIINAGRLFKKYDIVLQTTNIIGIPHETLDTVRKTIEINRKVYPQMAKTFILQPYIGTEIHKYAMELGLFDTKYAFDTGTGFQIDHDGTNERIPIKVPNEREMVNISYLFDFMVQHEKLDWLMWKLIKLPTNRFFKLIYEFPMIKQDIKFNGSFKLKIKIFIRWIKVLL